jgi:exopolysaccharide production protein ExoQ
MNPTVAFLIFSVGVAGLFFLNRDNSVRTSAALWLPVTWLWIVGSRPVSSWFGMESTSSSILDATLEGSPLDAAIFAALLGAGVLVLIHRRKLTRAYLGLSGSITVYFLYCLLSVMWSPFHEPAFKRWTKAVGDLVMVLVIVTDGDPIAAIRKVFSRVGFILFPYSVFMIRYTVTGRGYDPDGSPENVGLTTNKNSLGLIVFVISLGVVWNLRWLLKHKEEPNRGRRLVAQFTLLGFCLWLLQLAHSATSVICFLLGTGIMIVTGMDFIRRRPGRVLALSLGVVLAGGLGLLLGGGSAVSQSLGKGGGLSGRTDIWACSIAAAGNPLIGTGFESFWNANAFGVNHCLQVKGFRDLSNLNSAHNGYLQIYLDLGFIGVFLIALILIGGYRYASKAFARDSDAASLMLAFIATGTFYSITEVGFRILTPSWIFLLLGVLCSGGIASDRVGKISPMPAPVDRTAKIPLIRNNSKSSNWPKRNFEAGRVNRVAFDTVPA